MATKLSKTMAMADKKLTLYRFVAPEPKMYCTSNSNTKLETILRMANFKYDLASGNAFIAPKGKLPYIEFPNGQKMGDSNLIYKYLVATNQIKDLDADLSPIEKLHAESFRIFIEEWAHWLRLWDLWIVNYYKARSYIFAEGGLTWRPAQLVFGWLAYRKNRKNSRIQGFGVHNDKEITEFLVKAVELMATFVSEENRLADIERPCLAQATLFGFLLCTYRVKEVSTITMNEIGKYPELEAWTRRMAAKYYPEREFPA